ncbi:MAG: prolipoprotein diacylglyceryl transferase [Pseudomonadota bacterium]
MHPILINFREFNLYTYGLFMAISFMTAVFVSQKIAAPHGIKDQTVTDIFFIIMISGLIGARGLYVVIGFDSYKNNLFDIFKIWNGGLVFFGGFITAIIATAIYLKAQNLNIWKMADILSPGIALAHAVGRLGCLSAGCCYGESCELPFAITFTHPQSLAPLNVALHPTQIYMVLSNLFLFFILLWITRKKRFNGMVFLSYIMLYSLFRFIIEFFRGDFRGDFIFNFISMSQGIGLLVSLIAFILLIIRYKSVNDDR